MSAPRLIATAALLLLSASFLSAQETRGRFPEKMTVTVVDENGKPITHANGFHRFGQYVNFNVNEKGIFEIPMNEEKLKQWSTTDFTVKAEGYGPFSAHFKEDPIIPETFTVVLKPAQKIGGIVVDDDENPVEGVVVNFSIYFETSYKVESPPFVTTVETKTDTEGKWSFFQLPAIAQEAQFALQKEGYLRTFMGNIPVARLNPDAEGQYHEKIVIERGYVFSGKVIDETGTPIEGVTLQLGAYDAKPVRNSPLIISSFWCDRVVPSLDHVVSAHSQRFLFFLRDFFFRAVTSPIPTCRHRQARLRCRPPYASQ